ncbi:hypothetical protein QUV83_16245 [Cellulomonas cellasea]|uniref:hypothetical protein n=1 Tax=Cellulomonas cellasea TaxID=43670 RepID=UPI0025A312E2|nr:hypothetical protein [Cellulomonas cellasea]MDM8086326.1 hypothetical protein [Cellulomonas cellasea]
MSDHSVTVEWDRDGYPRYSFTCTAPAESDCHAHYECECESWVNSGIEDGKPWHSPEEWHEGDGLSEEIEVRHFGRFDAESCGLRDWFENCDDVMRGSITFPIKTEWHGGSYTFAPAEPTS